MHKFTNECIRKMITFVYFNTKTGMHNISLKRNKFPTFSVLFGTVRFLLFFFG